jgi:hypothetical protein
MRLFEEVRQNDVEAAPTLLLERLFVCGRGRTESLQACFLLHSLHVHIHAQQEGAPEISSDCDFLHLLHCAIAQVAHAIAGVAEMRLDQLRHAHRVENLARTPRAATNP